MSFIKKPILIEASTQASGLRTFAHNNKLNIFFEISFLYQTINIFFQFLLFSFES